MANLITPSIGVISRNNPVSGIPGVGSSLLYSDDARRWVDVFGGAVAANGGTLSTTRAGLLATLIGTAMDIGAWQLIDDIALLVAENAPQALTSLKRRLLMTAVAAPTFTTDRGYAFNGTTQYVNTGFNPTLHAVSMQQAVARIAAYERTNVNANTTTAGCNDLGSGAGRILAVRPRSNTTAFLGANCATGSFVVATDSRGYTAGSHTGTDGLIVDGYKNGVALTSVATASVATALPNLAIYIGASNTSGSAANFRASTVGEADWGACFQSTAQELAWYNALQTFMTAVGANV